MGRSNVGKSSLLNSLLERKRLARTSNTPGRTQSINYFLVNGSFYFVDLPGYGYARVSKAMRAEWGSSISEYLSQREELVLSIQLIDSRHKPTVLDLQLKEWLTANGREHIVVATKADKLSKSELAKQLILIGGSLSGASVFQYSAISGIGRNAVWQAINAAIAK